MVQKILTYEDCKNLFELKLHHGIFNHIFNIADENFSNDRMRLMLLEAYNNYTDHMERGCKREISSLRHLKHEFKINDAVTCANNYAEFMIQSGNFNTDGSRTVNHDYIMFDFEYKFFACAYKQIYRKSDNEMQSDLKLED